MFLEEIANPQTIVEATDDYGRKLYFDYRKVRKGKELLSHPSPIVFYLGTWRMTDKQGNKKKFICGINLAYLDEGDLAALQNALPDILKNKHTKIRYKIGKDLLPDIFRKAYRTYNTNNIATKLVRGRLYALKPSGEDKDEAKQLATRDGLEWSELENQERNKYLDQAIRKRGTADIKRQEKSKKEREQIDKHIERAEEEAEEAEARAEAEAQAEAEEEAQAEKEAEEEAEIETEPQKQPTEPTAPPRAFKPLELGPGYEEPEEKPEVPELTIQSPIRSVQTGMATPHNIKIKKPQPDEPATVKKEPDETPE